MATDVPVTPPEYDDNEGNDAYAGRRSGRGRGSERTHRSELRHGWAPLPAAIRGRTGRSNQ